MADDKKKAEPKAARPGPDVPQKAFEALAKHFRQDGPPTAEEKAAAKDVLACCKAQGGEAKGVTLSRAGLAAELSRRAVDGCGYTDWADLAASVAAYFPE